MGSFFVILINIRYEVNMGKHYFSEEQQQKLRNNPLIKKISEKAITYTQEFKERFSEEYKSGKLPSEILRGMGIDPRILGKSRVSNISSRVKANDWMGYTKLDRFLKVI